MSERLHGLVIAGVLAVIIGVVLGCAGPSKDRYRELLRECREANRERAGMIRDYRAARCAEHPEATFGALDFDEGGL